VASLPNSGRVHDLAPTGEALITSDNVSAGIRARGPGKTEERDLTWLDWSLPSSISADGRTLLFNEDGDGGGEHYSACIRGMDGSQPIRLGEGNAEDLSPDGKWALTTQFWTNPPGLVLLPTGAGQPQALPPTGLENIIVAEFFPSSKRMLIAGNEPGHPFRAFVRAADGGPLRPVTPEGILVRRNAISPDERWVVGMVRGREAKLYPVEGGAVREIPGRQPDELVFGWSADAKSVYVGAPGKRGDVSRVDLATGKRSPWAQCAGPEDRAGTTTGLVILGHDDHSYAYVYCRYLSELFLASGLR